MKMVVLGTVKQIFQTILAAQVQAMMMKQIQRRSARMRTMMMVMIHVTGMDAMEYPMMKVVPIRRIIAKMFVEMKELNRMPEACRVPESSAIVEQMVALLQSWEIALAKAQTMELGRD